MEGTSNFLIFDENNKNIMSDADYSTSPQRQNGVGNGIADPALHNKMFRQVSVFVSAFAQTLSDKGFVVNDSDYSALVTVLNNIAITSEYPKTLDNLTDVVITDPTDKQLLTYNFTNKKWENKTLDTNIGDNTVTDDAIGNRTLTDSTILTSYTGKYTDLLIGLLSMQKLITGKADGKTAPVASIETIWKLPWTEKFILFNPADLYVSPGIPLSRDGTMTTMDFYVTGTPASATVITVKKNGVELSPTVSLSAAGKTTLTFGTAVVGSADDLFSYSVAGGGLSACTVVANGKLVNR